VIRAAVRAGASRKNVVAAGARAREASIEREGPVNRIASTLRVLAHIGALLAAVVVPTLIVSLLAGTVRLGPFVLRTGLAYAILIGLPMYLVLRWKKCVNLVACVLGGFTAVALPIGFLTWPLRYPDLKSTASIDGVATMIDGVPTAAGWAFFASGVARFAVLGAIGGIVFWSVLKVAGELTSPNRPTRQRPIVAVASPLVAFLLAGAILSVPKLTADRSCHANYMANSHVSIDLQVDDGEWGAVTELLRDYSAAHQLSFRDSSQVRPDVLRLLYLSVCDDSRIHLLVNEQRWASDGYRNILEGRGIGIYIYRPADERAWRELAADLIADLQMRWPEAVRFRDGGGYVVPMPEELAPVRSR